MKHFKQACLASLVTLLLSLWLFGFQLQTEGVGLTVVNRLDGNGPILLLGVALVYLVLVMLFTWLLSKFERRMAQGDR